jgi:hypothetical protein
MFPIIKIPRHEADFLEPLGTKRKAWFLRENILFKEGRPGSGENWCEKVVSELCELIGLPHAVYDLAIWGDKKGVVSPNFVPEGGRLVHGNELLPKIDSEYDGAIFYRQRRHTLSRVLAVVRMKGINLPIGWKSFSGVDSAIDVFIGYLMLDAWIANQDRHHENWALLVSAERSVHLAPSYDHASGLGSHESDANREVRLTTRDKGRSIERYVERALSAFYLSHSDRKPLTTIDAFSRSARMRLDAAKSWVDRLEGVSFEDIITIFEQIPKTEITPLQTDFALKILELNQHRLVSLKKELK